LAAIIYFQIILLQVYRSEYQLSSAGSTNVVWAFPSF
jgi:hypothetical protein